jgi:hypothetical protein
MMVATLAHSPSGNTNCDKWPAKTCLKMMKREQEVDQKLSHLADFPLPCHHSGNFNKSTQATSKQRVGGSNILDSSGSSHTSAFPRHIEPRRTLLLFTI